ncbi:helix-turn-helix domain-containing protein [Vibrio marisflavi]|uniref:HTH cro/C1-type domain-containing protein n=1 Tax=Vibrio marisflavi CECT 7928 TaxID=634439 RepID=A0ABM8ZZ92_9VIBR|nr:helix-turn-helix transcriptional regulator [Vibrio marisflavi]CAH0536359.1 hypothetical protein VMF7928_00372 [Vibrio marisflavi CECT 7928]
MDFTQEDREALNQVWMSQKAKMRLTQMEMVKRLGLSQLEFSKLLRGVTPLSMTFVSEFCEQLHVDPRKVIPSLVQNNLATPKEVHLTSKMSVDGEIQRAYIEGNSVIVEYVHRAP